MSAAAKEPASAIDVVEMTVEGAQSGFASGAFTSESLTQAFLNRIAVYNPPYNAIVFMNPSALDDARSSDARRGSGKSLGPLDGVPVVVKDAMDMVGFPTTGGWRLLHSKTGGVDLHPATDAPVVARMRAAGAVILGKTNIPVLSATGSHANDSWAGPTYNAAGREFLPGGSSAGTATAVGASLAVLGLAEETGGSIQNPASAQGLVGIKPTFALVPNVGVLPLSSLRDVVGPIGRCVRDAALALDVLSGFTMADPKTVAGIGRKPPGGYAANLKPDALRGKRVGTYGPGWRNLPLSDEATALYRRALAEIEAQGAILVEDPFAGSGFADLRTPTVPGEEYDARGLEVTALRSRQISRAARTRRRDQDLRGVCGRDQGRGSVRADGGPPLHVASRGVQCLPCRPDEAARHVGLHRTQRKAPLDLQRGLCAPSAGRSDLPADARAASCA